MYLMNLLYFSSMVYSHLLHMRLTYTDRVRHQSYATPYNNTLFQMVQGERRETDESRNSSKLQTCNCHLFMWKHIRNRFCKRGHSRRSLFRMPPILHWTPKIRCSGRTYRPLQQEIWLQRRRRTRIRTFQPANIVWRVFNLGIKQIDFFSKHLIWREDIFP